jgi:hypothetical protein
MDLRVTVRWTGALGVSAAALRVFTHQNSFVRSKPPVLTTDRCASVAGGQWWVEILVHAMQARRHAMHYEPHAYQDGGETNRIQHEPPGPTGSARWPPAFSAANAMNQTSCAGERHGP